MSSSQSGEGEIRENLIEADLVDCIGALTKGTTLRDNPESEDQHLWLEVR